MTLLRKTEDIVKKKLSEICWWRFNILDFDVFLTFLE